jgi:hypothetical protein
MNTTAIPVDELICQLLDAADGIPADVAAAGLIISHGHFLHRDAFRRIISTGTSISTGQPLATIGWDAALRPPNRPSCGSPAASAIRKSPSACAPCWATSTPVTSPWSLTPSPPPTANHQATPESSARQPAAADSHSFRSGLALRTAAAPVLAFIRSAGRSGSRYPADHVT